MLVIPLKLDFLIPTVRTTILKCVIFWSFGSILTLAMKKLTKFSHFITNCNNKIWILFKEGILIIVMEDLQQMITWQINHNGLIDPILLSFIYAKSNPCLRIELWDSIRKFDPGLNPWALTGDFNATLSSGERSFAMHC